MQPQGSRGGGVGEYEEGSLVKGNRVWYLSNRAKGNQAKRKLNYFTR